MKFKAIILLLILLNVSCGSNQKFFNSGEVIINNDIEVVDLKIVKDLPLCQVTINGKEYWFLVDTGAAMVISKEIFNELNLKTLNSAAVGDSQKNKETQDFCLLPEIKIGNMTFKNIAAVAMTINNQELKCFGFDGIVGANLLAKLNWQFDYKNKKITASKNVALFNIDQSDFSLDFTYKSQKTPHVAGKVNDKAQDFTFDTGYAGNIKIANDLSYHQNLTSKEKFITKTGVNSIGVYGNSSSDLTFVMKNKLTLNSTVFEDEIIDSGASTLIGNEFLKNYVFVIDWNTNKIHFKKNSTFEPTELDGFGFTYLFVDGKAKVMSKVVDKNIPIELGDQILVINDTDFTKIQSSEFCKYFLDRIEKDETEINVTVKRAEEILKFNLTKQEFLK